MISVSLFILGLSVLESRFVFPPGIEISLPQSNRCSFWNEPLFLRLRNKVFIRAIVRGLRVLKGEQPLKTFPLLVSGIKTNSKGIADSTIVMGHGAGSDGKGFVKLIIQDGASRPENGHLMLHPPPVPPDKIGRITGTFFRILGKRLEFTTDTRVINASRDDRLRKRLCPTSANETCPSRSTFA